MKNSLLLLLAGVAVLIPGIYFAQGLVYSSPEKTETPVEKTETTDRVVTLKRDIRNIKSKADFTKKPLKEPTYKIQRAEDKKSTSSQPVPTSGRWAVSQEYVDEKLNSLEERIKSLKALPSLTKEGQLRLKKYEQLYEDLKNQKK